MVDEELLPQAGPADEGDLGAAAAAVAERAAVAVVDGRMPAVYLGHGAPPLVDDPLWVAQLAAWAGALPRPQAILMVSAHWTEAPLTFGATAPGVPLVYDFYGFPRKYYETTYPAPPAPELAQRVRGLLDGVGPVQESPGRGLDHGAYVPLLVMYPEADVPVLQISMPSLEPERLLALGAALRPLRDEGVLLIGSGFLTHGLPFLSDFRTDAPPPQWSSDFDRWAAEALERRDLRGLADFRGVPSARYAHPTTEHLVPLFVTLGAADEGAVMATPITGYFLGLSKRSIQVA
jgi:4,5-DOPA dioxygenase extradiol